VTSSLAATTGRAADGRRRGDLNQAGSVARVLAVALVLGAVALLVGIPLWSLIRVAAEGGWVAAASTVSASRAPLANTLRASLAATALAVLLGTALAVRAQRGTLPRARILAPALVVSLLCPEFVLAVSWLQAYGPAGLSDAALHLTIPGLLGPVGIVLVLACHAVPIVFFMVRSALATRREAQLELAARASGATGWSVFRTITLPLVVGPAGAAASVVYALCVNNFAVPEVLGAPAGYPTLSTTVYSTLSLASDRPTFVSVCVLAAAMVLLTIGVLAMIDHGGVMGSAAVRTAPESAVPMADRRAGLGWSAAIIGYVLLTVVVPALALLAAAVTKAPGLAPVPSNWTTDNVVRALQPRYLAALGRTALLAAVAALVLVALAFLASAQPRRRRRATLATLIAVGLAVPGSALAVGIGIGYGRLVAVGTGSILLAYLAKFWAIAHRPITAALDRLAPALGQAARAAGATPATTIRTVTLPLTRAAATTGGLMVFLLALHEVTMSSILYAPGAETFAVVVLDHQQLGDTGVTAALAVVLAAPPLLVVTVLLLLRRART